jgi:glycine betaine catabolism B
MNNKEKSTAGEPQNAEKEDIPTRPLKLQLKLLEKIPYMGTDVVSFRFSRRTYVDSGQQLQKQQQEQEEMYYLNYKAGQYAIVDLGTREDPEGPVRSFTIASSPTVEYLILISTRIRDTPFKKKLANLDIESAVKITAPLGKFVLHEDYSKAAVFLSGGIGVTPFRSMIKYATDKQLPIKIIVFDSNRNQDSILYKKEFDEWANINENLKIIYTITDEREALPSSPSSTTANDDWKGERGFINKAMLSKYLSTTELDASIFYICGPPGMLNAMQKLLQDDLHIPKQRIRIEEFVGY